MGRTSGGEGVQKKKKIGVPCLLQIGKDENKTSWLAPSPARGGKECAPAGRGEEQRTKKKSLKERGPTTDDRTGRRGPPALREKTSSSPT